MTNAEFIQRISNAVEIREKGNPKAAELKFLELEAVARQANNIHQELAAAGQRADCYLHLYEDGQEAYLPKLLELSRLEIKLSEMLRGKPEIRAFRFRYAQGLYLSNRLREAYTQICMALGKLPTTDKQYFQFMPLKALIAFALSRTYTPGTPTAIQFMAMSSEAIADSLVAVDDWIKKHQTDPDGIKMGKVYKSGVLLHLAQIYFISQPDAGIDGLEEHEKAVLKSLDKLVNDLETTHKYVERKKQWERLKRINAPKKTRSKHTR